MNLGILRCHQCDIVIDILINIEHTLVFIFIIAFMKAVVSTKKFALKIM